MDGLMDDSPVGWMVYWLVALVIIIVSSYVIELWQPDFFYVSQSLVVAAHHIVVVGI
jgi:hypothetical protein